jgi:PncC family amidohydrolase
VSPAGPAPESRPPESTRPESGPPESGQAAGIIIARLTAREQTVAVAESLTGGLVAAALTAVPGASAAFRGAVVAYATSLKATLLDVSPHLLGALGAVSPEVAAAMAEGVRGRLGATWGAATTGVAGPDAAEGKPVGTVHIAVSDAGGTTVRSLALAGSRDEVRQRTVEEVLGLLLGRIRES